MNYSLTVWTYLVNYDTSKTILCASFAEHICHSFCDQGQHLFIPVIKFNFLGLAELFKVCVSPVSRNAPFLGNLNDYN